MHHTQILGAKRKEQSEARYLRPTQSRVQVINTTHVKCNSVIVYNLSSAGAVRNTKKERKTAIVAS